MTTTPSPEAGREVGTRALLDAIAEGNAHDQLRLGDVFHGLGEAKRLVIPLDLGLHVLRHHEPTARKPPQKIQLADVDEVDQHVGIREDHHC